MTRKNGVIAYVNRYSAPGKFFQSAGSMVLILNSYILGGMKAGMGIQESQDQ
ncbi:MAG: hypothetical protein ABI270_11060 [Nitrosospira sp.]